MTSLEKYKDLLIDLVEKGVNFDQDVFLRNSGNNWGFDWAELAKKYGYRKPKGGYFATGGHFYMLLRRVFLANREMIVNAAAEKIRMKTVIGIK